MTKLETRLAQFAAESANLARQAVPSLLNESERKNIMQTINFGETLTCSETGKQFIAAREGCTTNYARDSAGNVFSDEGVDIREKRELLDRSKPFYCYVSSDGKTVGGWKGNKLGTIHNYGESRSGWNGDVIARFHVVDVHGQWWQGRGAGKGICCTLRAMKKPTYAANWGSK